MDFLNVTSELANASSAAGVAVRQDGVPVGLHGAGRAAAQRAAVDPGRRLHRQVLHRVRRRQQAHRLRARRLASSGIPPSLLFYVVSTSCLPLYPVLGRHPVI